MTLTRMVSFNAMVKQVAGLANTRDVTDVESRFITSILDRTDQGKNVSGLSERQASWIEDLWRRHFA